MGSCKVNNVLNRVLTTVLSHWDYVPIKPPLAYPEVYEHVQPLIRAYSRAATALQQRCNARTPSDYSGMYQIPASTKFSHFVHIPNYKSLIRWVRVQNHYVT